jgi:hypothetical protein
MDIFFFFREGSIGNGFAAVRHQCAGVRSRTALRQALA